MRMLRRTARWIAGFGVGSVALRLARVALSLAFTPGAAPWGLGRGTCVASWNI